MTRFESQQQEHAALMMCIAKHHKTTSPGMIVAALEIGARMIEELEAALRVRANA